MPRRRSLLTIIRDRVELVEQVRRGADRTGELIRLRADTFERRQSRAELLDLGSHGPGPSLIASSRSCLTSPGEERRDRSPRFGRPHHPEPVNREGPDAVAAAVGGEKLNDVATTETLHARARVDSVCGWGPRPPSAQAPEPSCLDAAAPSGCAPCRLCGRQCGRTRSRARRRPRGVPSLCSRAGSYWV